jgi:ElaB/YqjD/DUF883 family membrane-anchored ribosome-binding protein
MKSDPQSQSESENIRSEIDSTRNRMDETIDELGNRFQGRHLIDEVVGFFRRGDSDGEVGEWREKITRSANAVADSVKAHPVPLLMIGAGIAWLVYENRSSVRRSSWDDARGFDAMSEDYSPSDYESYVPPGSEGTYAAGEATEDFEGAEGESVASKAREKLSAAGSRAREKMSDLKERGREQLGAARERVADLGHRAQERGREIYGKTRERVVTTADQHPLEVGIGLLALGVIAGMAIPTPEAVTRRLSPAGDKLREASSGLLEKGKRVARAAGQAAKVEAKTQGLTLERVREQARAVGEKAEEAAANTARQEGLPVGGNTGNAAANKPTGAPSAGSTTPPRPV